MFIRRSWKVIKHGTRTIIATVRVGMSLTLNIFRNDGDGDGNDYDGAWPIVFLWSEICQHLFGCAYPVHYVEIESEQM